MASVINDPNGRRRIQFTDPDDKRRTIRLGKIARTGAEQFARHVEEMLSVADQRVKRQHCRKADFASHNSHGKSGNLCK